MAKLVVLNEGLKGRTYELATVLTTVGRLEDNSFQIPEPSVSSHHCEIMLRGSDIVIKDLNSTNGTYINGQQIQGESLVRPGQTLRLGTVEVRLEDENTPAAPPVPTAAPASAPGAPPPPPRKQMDSQTMVVPQGGVKLNQDQATRTMTFDKNSPFSKKSNKGTKLFVIVAAVVGLAILGAIIVLITSFGGNQ